MGRVLSGGWVVSMQRGAGCVDAKMRIEGGLDNWASHVLLERTYNRCCRRGKTLGSTSGGASRFLITAALALEFNAKGRRPLGLRCRPVSFLEGLM